MKKTLTLLIILSGISTISAQCPPSANVTLEDQQAVNNFATNASTCDTIQGYLQIGPNNASLQSDITDISGLSNIKHVKGNLIIKRNEFLEDLSGFDGITIGGGIYITENEALNDISVLFNVGPEVNEIQVFDNNLLATLNGLQGIETVSGSITINRNALINLEGLNNLNHIEGGLYLGHSIAEFNEIENYSNQNLASLDGLENLTYIGSYFFLMNNYLLSSITALSNLTHVGDELCLGKLYNLSSLEGLEGLVHIPGPVYMGLSLMSGNGFEVDYYPMVIDDLSGLSNLNTIDGGLTIGYCEDLTSLEGLDNLTSVSYFTIEGCESITSLEGANNLSQSADITLYYNQQLTACAVDWMCNYLDNDGTLNIYGGISSCSSQTEIEQACDPAYNRALNFDGVDDYVEIERPALFDNLSENSFTIESWILPTGTLPITAFSFRKDQNNFLDVSYTLGGYLSVELYVDGENKSLLTNDGLPLDQWQHLAISWNATADELKIYVNGIEPASSELTSITTGVTPKLLLGTNLSLDNFFRGKMDEFRIWSFARNGCSILEFMDQEIDGAYSSLVSYYDFNQGEIGLNNLDEDELIDLSVNYNDGQLINFQLAGAESNWVGSGLVANPEEEPDFEHQVTIEICNGDSYQFGQQLLSESGNYLENLSLDSGCDSLVYLDFSVFTVNTDFNDYGGDFFMAEAENALYQWGSCNSNGEFETISGAIDQTFYPSTDGEYAVMVTQNNCTAISECMWFIIISTDDLINNQEIILSPNPVEGEINLSSSSILEDFQFRIFNTTGSLISSIEKKSSFPVTINTEALSPGVYILEIRSEHQVLYKQFVKM